MKLFKTYKEAVTANGSIDGVYKNEITGEFCHRVAGGVGLSEYWVECHPAYYLESLESFLDRGKVLVDYDSYTDITGTLVTVGKDVSTAIVNNKVTDDDKLFVFQAAANEIATSEEKEAFDNIPNQITIDAINSINEKESYCSSSDMLDTIDTTPQQVESLSGSGKPNSSEWNGEGLPPVGAEFDFSYNGVSWERRVMLFNDGIICLIAHSEYTKNRWHYKCDDPNIMFRKPETPAEREQRERLKAAYDLYCDFTNSNVVDATCMCSYDFERSIFLPKWLTVVDKTGYRKREV